MIKEGQITTSNVDDFIREQKAKGVKAIHWNKENYEIFTCFLKAALTCGVGFDLYIFLMDFCEKNHNHLPKKEGFNFMGVKHYVSTNNRSKENPQT